MTFRRTRRRAPAASPFEARLRDRLVKVDRKLAHDPFLSPTEATALRRTRRAAIHQLQTFHA